MWNVEVFTGGIAQTNGYLIQSGGTHWVVDAPEGFCRWMEERGVMPKSLWLTHQHFDHVIDAAKIVGRWGCPVVAFADYSAELTLEKLFGAFTGTQFSVEPFLVAQKVKEGELFECGGLTWKVFHIPGHSPDSVAFYSEAAGAVFSGDALFRDGVGRTDFPGGDWELLLGGIREKLLVLPDDTTVFPGHGPSTSILRERKQNPLLLE